MIVIITFISKSPSIFLFFLLMMENKPFESSSSLIKSQMSSSSSRSKTRSSSLSWMLCCGELSVTKKKRNDEEGGKRHFLRSQSPQLFLRCSRVHQIVIQNEIFSIILKHRHTFLLCFEGEQVSAQSEEEEEEEKGLERRILLRGEL